MNRIPKLKGPSLLHAIDWIKALDDTGLAYHFDDAPETLTYNIDGARVFTDKECNRLNKLVPKVLDICEANHRDAFEIALTYGNMKDNWDMEDAGFDFKGDYEAESKDGEYSIYIEREYSGRAGCLAYDWQAIVAGEGIVDSGTAWTAIDAAYAAREACQHWQFKNC